jgi:hypothetical protein
MIAKTAKTVETVLESLILSSGSKPVRISQRPSKIIPTLLLRMLLVRLICVLHSRVRAAALPD